MFKSKTMKLHTTRSWDFMGLTLDYSGGMPLQLTHGEDTILGVFDTGACEYIYYYIMGMALID